MADISKAVAKILYPAKKNCSSIVIPSFLKKEALILHNFAAELHKDQTKKSTSKDYLLQPGPHLSIHMSTAKNIAFASLE